MQASPQRVATCPVELDFRPVFNVLALCEDSATCRRARRFERMLDGSMDVDCRLRHTLWRFADLGEPNRRRALDDAIAHADVVIVATHAHNHLPPEVKAFLRKSLKKGSDRGEMLVALLDRSAHGSATARCLERMATAAGVAFSCCCGGPMNIPVCD